MELKLSKKKYITEDNLKRIVKVGINFGERLNSIESACIEDFSESKNYLRGDACYKDGYIYRAVVSTTGAWVDSRWAKVGDEFTELTKSDIEAMLNLSQEELDNLQNLLKDDQITTTSTHSSSKIYSDIQAAIETAKEYTNEQTGKCVKPAYKVVASTSDVTETGYFYLISNGTNYDMYVLSADGSVVSLGTSDVDLSDYAKLTDLDNYYDKTTSDGKFALITTVDEKIDKTDIATSLDDTVTDEQVTSALLTKTELDKLSTSLGGLSDSLVDKQDYKFVVESGSRYVEDDVTQEINNWLPNDNSSILINLKKLRGEKYENFQLICNKTDSQNWECIVNGQNVLWKINYVNGVRTIQELATMDKVEQVSDVAITTKSGFTINSGATSIKRNSTNVIGNARIQGTFEVGKWIEVANLNASSRQSYLFDVVINTNSGKLIGTCRINNDAISVFLEETATSIDIPIRFIIGNL